MFSGMATALSLRKKCFRGARHSSSGAFFSSIAMSFIHRTENVAAFLGIPHIRSLSSRQTTALGMFSPFGTDFLLGGWRGLAGRHKRVDRSTLEQGGFCPIAEIFCGGEAKMSSTWRRLAGQRCYRVEIGTKRASAVKDHDEREETQWVECDLKVELRVQIRSRSSVFLQPDGEGFSFQRSA